MSKVKVGMVFSGAGTHAGLLAGAYMQASKEMEAEEVVGTSAGAMIAAAIASGWSPEGIRNLILGADFKQLIPLNYFMAPFRGYLASNKHVHQFMMMITAGKTMFQAQIPITTIATDVLTGQVKIFDRIRTPNVLIADAVVASMSVPDVFPLAQGRYCDGGLYCNFGPQYLSSKKKIGFRVSSPMAVLKKPSFFRRQSRFINIALAGSEDADMRLARAVGAKVITIRAGNDPFLDRDLTEDQKTAMLKKGMGAANVFLWSPEWEKLKAK